MEYFEEEFLCGQVPRKTAVILSELKKPKHERSQPIRTYMKSACGRLECDRCGRWWESAKVMISLHFIQHSGEERARGYTIGDILGQACESCQTKSVGRKVFYNAAIEEEEWDRILQSFHNILTSPLKTTTTTDNETRTVITPPHKQSLCEHCIRLGSPCWQKNNTVLTGTHVGHTDTCAPQPKLNTHQPPPIKQTPAIGNVTHPTNAHHSHQSQPQSHQRCIGFVVLFAIVSVLAVLVISFLLV